MRCPDEPSVYAGQTSPLYERERMRMVEEHRRLEVHQSSLLLLMALLLQTGTREGAQAEAPGSSTFTSWNCSRTCGGVDVPYPFGLKGDGDACHFDDGNTTIASSFTLICNHTFDPPKLFTRSIRITLFDNKDYNINYKTAGEFKELSHINDVEVTGINISSGHLRVLLPLAYDCYDRFGNYSDSTGVKVTLRDPFVFSPTENVFKGVGCDAVVGFSTEVYNSGGCVSGCNSLETAVDGECSGLGCCQAPVLPGIKAYDTWSNEQDDDSDIYKFNPCFFYFIAEKNSYTFKRSDLRTLDKKRRLPVIVDWSIGYRRCDQAARNASSYVCVAGYSECVDRANSTTGYLCKCRRGFEGNPYIRDGCTDIDECRKGRAIYPCYGECTNTVGGYECRCLKGYESRYPKTEECLKKSQRTRNLILAFGILGGLLLLAFIGSLSCLESQRRKINVLRKKYFASNGGIFLQELLSVHQSAFKIFSYDQLKKATNKFSKSNILGRGGFGIVYKGITEDGIQIAVKKSTMISEKNSRQFANELFILSQVNHNNIVKLLGCCLEDESPMLVYEFIPKGTLFDYIHRNEQRIGFDTRLRIATQVAEAFDYLHFTATPPILHGDVKSSNILLDDDLRPKVSDFGTSKLAPNDKSKFTTLIQGTYGYLDPEYLTTGALTDKSDVFGFGVILLELITRKTPLNFTTDVDAERILYVNFLSCVNTNRLTEILDPDIAEEGLAGEVEKLVRVAMDCLEMEAEKRPTVKEVAFRLQSIKVPEVDLERYPYSPSPKSPLQASPNTSLFTAPQSAIFESRSRTGR